MDNTPQQPRWLALTLKYGPFALALLAWGYTAFIALKEGKFPTQPPPPLPIVDELSTPLDYEGVSFHGDQCDQCDQLHGPQAVSSNGRPWPTRHLTYSIDYNSAHQLRPALPEDAIRGAFKQAWGWWTESLDLEAEEVADPNKALVRIRFERMDGNAGVLAESYLADGTLRPKTQRYDLERWTAGPPVSGYLSLPTVACHEIGHVLGLGHDDANAPAVMRPSYTGQIPREQPRDIDRMIALGYDRRTKPSPANPGGNGVMLAFPVSAKASDLADALRKAGAKVEFPLSP